MNPFALLILIFLIVPIVEIYLFIQVGGVIGAPATIGIVLLTAVAGAWLFRAQGLSTLARARNSMAQGQVPAMELMEGVFLLLAGAFLLTPGFFTDALGFAFLIPPLRRGLIQLALRRSVIRFSQTGSHPPGASQRPGPHRHSTDRNQGATLEGEYRRED